MFHDSCEPWGATLWLCTYPFGLPATVSRRFQKKNSTVEINCGSLSIENHQYVESSAAAPEKLSPLVSLIPMPQNLKAIWLPLEKSIGEGFARGWKQCKLCQLGVCACLMNRTRTHLAASSLLWIFITTSSWPVKIQSWIELINFNQFQTCVNCKWTRPNCHRWRSASKPQGDEIGWNKQEVPRLKLDAADGQSKSRTKGIHWQFLDLFVLIRWITPWSWTLTHRSLLAKKKRYRVDVMQREVCNLLWVMIFFSAVVIWGRCMLWHDAQDPKEAGPAGQPGILILRHTAREGYCTVLT